jgi:hypothetical protein
MQTRPSYSPADRPLGFDIKGVDRLARRHEEAVALEPAKAQIGAALGEEDTADQLAVGGEDGDAILGRTARGDASLEYLVCLP